MWRLIGTLDRKALPSNMEINTARLPKSGNHVSCSYLIRVYRGLPTSLLHPARHRSIRMATRMHLMEEVSVWALRGTQEQECTPTSITE